MDIMKALAELVLAMALALTSAHHLLHYYALLDRSLPDRSPANNSPDRSPLDQALKLLIPIYTIR